MTTTSWLSAAERETLTDAALLRSPVRVPGPPGMYEFSGRSAIAATDDRGLVTAVACGAALTLLDPADLPGVIAILSQPQSIEAIQASGMQTMSRAMTNLTNAANPSTSAELYRAMGLLSMKISGVQPRSAATPPEPEVVAERGYKALEAAGVVMVLTRAERNYLREQMALLTHQLAPDRPQWFDQEQRDVLRTMVTNARFMRDDDLVRKLVNEPRAGTLDRWESARYAFEQGGGLDSAMQYARMVMLQALTRPEVLAFLCGPCDSSGSVRHGLDTIAEREPDLASAIRVAMAAHEEAAAETEAPSPT